MDSLDLPVRFGRCVRSLSSPWITDYFEYRWGRSASEEERAQAYCDASGHRLQLCVRKVRARYGYVELQVSWNNPLFRASASLVLMLEPDMVRAGDHDGPLIAQELSRAAREAVQRMVAAMALHFLTQTADWGAPLRSPELDLPDIGEALLKTLQKQKEEKND